MLQASRTAFPQWVWEGNAQQARTDFGCDGRLYLHITQGDTKPCKATLYQSRGRHVVASSEASTVAEAVGQVLYAVAVNAIYGGKVTVLVPL